MSRLTKGTPFRNSLSHELTDEARTFISSSSSFGTGIGTSRSSRPSGEPYCVNTIAFMDIDCPMSLLRSPRTMQRSRSAP
jgi:hypothetical protein